jgi:hypothetical protein
VLPVLGRLHIGQYFEAPPTASEVERHNFHHAFRESALIGVINAAIAFLPVFIARLGGTNFQVSLVTSLPSLVGVLLAIPLGSFMQTRRNIMPWYARGRIGSQLSYALVALVSLMLPAPHVVQGILVVYALATIFQTMTNVSFNIVMDATAGTQGRFELMSRRWSIMGAAQAISLIAVGAVLGRLPFPLNYQIVFIGFALTGVWAYQYGSRIIVPDHPAATRGGSGESAVTRLRGLLRLVLSQRQFFAFEGRRFVYAISATLALPLVPLYYVRVLHAPDQWIAVMAATQTLSLLVGYALWRQQARTRGSQFVLAAATFGAALYPAALGFTHMFLLVTILAGVGAVFTAGVNLAIFDRLMAKVPVGYGVTFNSIDTTVVFIAGSLPPLLVPALASAVGVAGALRVAAAIGLLGALLFALDRDRGPAPAPTLHPTEASAP